MDLGWERKSTLVAGERLVRVVSAEHIPVWLNKPVPALGDHKPLDVLAASEYRRVATLISELEAPTFS